MMTKKKTTTELIAEHAEWLQLYREISVLAGAGYPAQLTEDEMASYRSLPDLLDHCKESFEAIPEALRPEHYLMTVRNVL